MTLLAAMATLAKQQRNTGKTWRPTLVRAAQLGLALILMLLPSALAGQTREQKVDSVMKANKLGKYNPNNRGYVADVPNGMKIMPTYSPAERDSIREAVKHDLRVLSLTQAMIWQERGAFAPDLRLLRPTLRQLQAKNQSMRFYTDENVMIEMAIDYHAFRGGMTTVEEVQMRMWVPGSADCNITFVAPDGLLQPECVQ